MTKIRRGASGFIGHSPDGNAGRRPEKQNFGPGANTTLFACQVKGKRNRSGDLIAIVRCDIENAILIEFGQTHHMRQRRRAGLMWNDKIDVFVLPSRLIQQPIDAGMKVFNRSLNKAIPSIENNVLRSKASRSL